MRKTTKIDFLAVAEDSQDLDLILSQLSQVPVDNHRRTIEHQEDWLRLSHIEMGDKGAFGDMMRISMSPPGFRAKLDGSVEALVFQSDEGMAESAAFYYDFETRIMALQRNAKAVSASQLSHYFKRVADVETFNLIPVLRPIDLKKVHSLQQIRKVHLSANITDVMATLDDIDSQTESMIKNAMQAESPAIELVLKSGRGKESTLNEAVAMEVLESWLKIHRNYADDENEIVKKIQITGKDNTGERLDYDILKDRMYTGMEYDWVPDPEQLWENRKQQLQVAWDLNHKNVYQNLKEMLPSGGE